MRIGIRSQTTYRRLLCISKTCRLAEMLVFFIYTYMNILIYLYMLKALEFYILHSHIFLVFG